MDSKTNDYGRDLKMDLTKQSFIDMFLNEEVKKVELSSMSGGIIYLRSLSYADVVRFRNLVKELNGKFAFSMIAGEDIKRNQESLFDSAEDYLLKSTLCDPSGKILFDDDSDDFIKWRENISPNVANEIIENIHKNNQLYKNITNENIDDINRKSDEDFKKKQN